jgi:hypothetical protein
MSIQLPAAEVYGLARALWAAEVTAQDFGNGLGDPGDVGAHLSTAVEAFLECQRMTGRALAGELRWLGDTVDAVADSWLGFDATVLATHARAHGR